jgi:MoaA/NifB/PqqE/SkfB family radical SAM enzyme
MPGLVDHDYVSMTLEFRCNLKCEHCMIEDTMDYLQAEPPQKFDELLAYNAEHRRWSGLIMTGSEITLRHDLPELATRARQSGFDHVRIQTHGMRLSNKDYCRELIDAGVDEFFISVISGDRDTHDAVARVARAYDRTMAGLENLESFAHVSSLTNTVVTSRNYSQLPALVERLSHLKRLRQMEFWVYLPMAESDTKGLIASHLDARPFLLEAVRALRALGRGAVVKHYPQCLLGDYADALDNAQPKLFIDPAFWKQFSRNGFGQCVHSQTCASKQCLGLTTAYIEKFGLHEQELKPFGDASPDLRRAV